MPIYTGFDLNDLCIFYSGMYVYIYIYIYIYCYCLWFDIKETISYQFFVISVFIQKNYLSSCHSSSTSVVKGALSADIHLLRFRLCVLIKQRYIYIYIYIFLSAMSFNDLYVYSVK